MFLYFFQIWNPTLPDPVPPLKDAKVDAYIPTYNEEPELLRGTIVAALEMDYPHETYVLDDGNRPEVRMLAEELGAKYISRDSNIHAKAGNLNHAMEITDGDFIIVFDSDHVAERHFITRTLGYFADDDLAFIQTPHSYYNFDSFQGSLNYDKRFYWEEGQLFYNIVQPGKNHWNAASFCGSAAIFRKSALESVGLIATESITEDMQTGLRLHANGWNSLYINERLVSGLAAPDIETFSIQRLRWGEGNLGTIFYDNPITMKGLTFAQRLNYLALMLSWTTGVQKLILYYTPLLMLLTGVGPVADMTWHLVLITILYVCNVWYTVKASGNGYGRLIDTEITQMATFWTQCRGTYRALFNRKKANFVVTQKSGGGQETSIHDFLRPQYTFIGCSIVAITWAASRYFLGVSEDFLGLSICSVLVGVHCIFAWIVIRRALAQRRFDWRHPCAAHISYELETENGIQRGEGITKDLCETGVGFLSYQRLEGHEMQMTITAGDSSVTVRGKVCNWESLVNYESRKEGKVQCYRYGVQFIGLTKEQLRRLWHITTKYSVARRYVEFDPNSDEEIFQPVTAPNDHPLSVPIRLYRPDIGDVFSVTETMTNNEFTLLSREDLRERNHLRAELTTPTGEITGNVRVLKAKDVDLGQMPLFAYRMKFDAFDGQSRGKLTTLMHLSHNPELATVTTLRPKKTRMPLALPSTIVGTITAIAATITIMAALFFCHDQVLMARAAMGKPLDASGRERLTRLVSDYERNPTLNERHFLRLREAMIAIKDEDATSRLNEALVTNEFESPAARLQQAYTLEELGYVEKAREAFALLMENLQEFKSRRTRANVILAAARNAVRREELDEAEKLYETVWEEGTAQTEIRVEYAGILATQKKYSEANEVLTSDELTLDDLYLQASLFAGMKRYDRARRIYKTLSLEYPDDIRAKRGAANIEAWTKNYDVAIQRYQDVLTQWPNDIETQISLTQALAWNKDRRQAIRSGVALIPAADGEGRLKIWIAILESIAELDEVSADDQVIVMKAFSERKNYAHHQYFLERLADCLLFEFDADQAAPLVEQLVGMCPESNLLHTRYAQTLYKMGDFNEAAKHYEHLIVNDALPVALKDRGDVLLAAAFNSAQRGATTEATKRYNMAMNCYMELIQQDQLETTYWLPFLDAVSGSQEHTKDVSLTVLEIFNARSSIADERNTMLRLSDALSKVKEDRLAMQVLDELTTHAADVETLWRRANVLLRLGKHEEADLIYEELIQDEVFADKEEQQVQLLLAAANNALRLDRESRAKSRFGIALSSLRTRLKKRPSQSPLWIPFLTAVSGMRGSSEDDMILVMNIYRERSRMAENVEFLDRLKDVLLIAKMHDKTLPLFELLLKQRPHSRRLQLQYARALHISGEHDQAEIVFDALSQKRRPDLDPAEDVPDHEVYISAADNALAQGKRRIAMLLYRKTIDTLEPLLIRDISDTQYWPPFLSALSGLNSVPTKHAELVTEIYRNRDLYEEEADFIANLGHVMILMEQYRPAIDLLKQATLRFPDDKKLRVELATGFSAMGDYEQANAYYRWVVDRTSRSGDLLGESRLLMQAALNSQHLNAKEDFEKYSTRALEILSDQLNANLEIVTLWQPFLDAAAGASNLSARDHEVVIALFKRWRQRQHDSMFLNRLADVLVKSGDVRRAIILLEHQEEQSPKTRLRLAMLLKEVGEFASAEARFRELLARKFFKKDLGTLADLLLAAADNAKYLGEPELSKSRYSEALRLLRQSGELPLQTDIAIRYLSAIGGATDITPEDVDNVLEIRRNWVNIQDPEFRSRLVDVMLKLDRPQDALPILQTLVDEWPDANDHQLRLAKTLQSLGEYNDAGAIYDRLIDGGTITPQSPIYDDLYASAARNSLSHEDYATARRRFEILFEQPVDRKEFEVEYALTLEKTGQREHAIELLEQKTDLAREHRYLLASMYAGGEAYARAQLMYEQLLKDFPTDIQALRGLADVAFWSKDYAQAIPLYRRLADDDPDNAQLHESLASALLWGGNRRAALAEFTTLLQSDPRQQSLWIRFLEATTAANNLSSQQLRLITLIENQLGSLPLQESREIRERLADVYTVHGQHARAINVLESLMVAAPHDERLRAKYAMALIGIGRTTEALPLLINLVKEDPNSDELRTQLAHAYVVAGDDQRANEEMSLLISRANQRETIDYARLLLGAASVSQRLKLPEESANRFAAALDILSVKLKEDETNVELWQPFLDAAAGARQFSSAIGQQAIKIYDRRSEHEPTKTFLTRVADVMSILDRPRDVLPILRRLAKRYPEDHEIEGRLASVYMTLEDYDRALPLLKRLAKRSTAAWKWRTQLANALHTSKTYDEAEELYRQLIASPDYPKEFQASLLLGAARNSVALKQFDVAQIRFEKRRDLLNGADSVDAEYAGVLLELGEPQRVVELLSHRELSISLKRVLASAHETLGERDAARELFAQILSEAPLDDGAMRGLARIALADGEYELSIDLYDQLLQLHPQDEILQFDRGIAYLSCQRFDEAASAFYGLLEADLDRGKVDLAFLQSLAGLDLLTERQITAAAVIQQRLLGEVDVDVRLVISLADVLLRAGKPQEVLQLTEPYIIEPDQSDEVAQRHAHALLSTGSAREAVVIYRAWLNRDPKNSQAKYLLALALHASDQYDLADGYLRDLLRRDHPEGDWYLAAADCAAALGQHERAHQLSAEATTALLKQFTAGDLPRRDWGHLLRAINNAQETSKPAEEAVVEIYRQVTKDLSDETSGTLGGLLVELAKALGRLDRTEQVNRLLDYLATSNLSDQPVIEKYADLLMGMQRYQQAMPLYRDLLQNNPARPLYPMQLARAHYSLGQYQEAAAYFQQVLDDELWFKQVGQHHVDFLLSAADNSRRLGRAAEAKQRYHVALERLVFDLRRDFLVSSRWIDFLFAFVGVSDQEAASATEAKRLVHRIFQKRHVVKFETNKAQREFSFALANALLRCEAYADSKLLLIDILKANELDQQARLQLARVLEQQEQYETAATHYDQILKQDLLGKTTAEQIQIWMSAGFVYTQVNRSHEASALNHRALHVMREALASQTNQAELWLPFLRAISIAGDYADVDVAIVRNIFALNDRQAESNQRSNQRSNDREFRILLADGLAKIGQSSDAIGLLESLGDEPTVYWRMGVLLSSLGRYASALEYFEKIEQAGQIPESDPRRDDFLLAMADAERRVGYTKRANDHFELVAVKYRPIVTDADASTISWRRYLQSIRGFELLPEEDVDVYRVAQRNLDRFSQEQDIVDALCDIALVVEDKPAAAIEFIDRGLDLFPESIGARFAKARGLFDAAQLDAADTLLTTLRAELQEAARNFGVGKQELGQHLGRWLSAAGSGEITLLHGRVKVGLEQYEQALKLFESAPQISDVDPLEYAAVLSKAGEVDKAIEVLSSKADKHPEALAFLASLYIEQERFDQARSIVAAALAENPDDRDIQRLLANTLFWAREYEEAIEKYGELLKHFPDDRELRISLGKSLLWIGRYDEASVLLSKLVKEVATDTQLWVPTLDALAGTEKASLQDPALLLIKKAYKDEPTEIQHDVVERLSRIYRRASEPMLARKHLLPYIAAKDVPVAIQIEFADVLSALKNHDEAIDIYQRVLHDLVVTDNAEELEVRLRYADVLHQAKRYEASQEQLDRLLDQLDDQNPSRLGHALLSTARNLVALDRNKEALEYFEQLRELDPDSFDLYEEYAGALLSASRPQEALTWLNQAPQLSLDGEYLLGAIYSNLEAFARAVKVYENIVNRYPKQLRAWRLLADNATWSKDYRTGIHVYKQLLLRAPDDESLRIAFADACLWSGKHQIALDIYFDILSASPDRYDLWANFVRAATGDVRVTSGVQNLLQSIVLTRKDWPSDFNFRLSMVDALIRLGNDQSAISLLHELMQQHPKDRVLRRRLADELHRLKRFQDAEVIYDGLLKDSRPPEPTRTPLSVETRTVGGIAE